VAQFRLVALAERLADAQGSRFQEVLDGHVVARSFEAARQFSSVTCVAGPTVAETMSTRSGENATSLFEA